MKRAALCLAALVILGGGTSAGAFPDATPWDQDCAACHTERELPGGTNLTLSGLPAQARPGGLYPLTIRLEHMGMRRAGMRLLVQGCEGDPGQLRVTGNGLETEGAKARTTYDGTTLPRGTSSQLWQLEWQAPEGGDCQLTFDLRANAANDDLSPLGDVIYRVDEMISVDSGR